MKKLALAVLVALSLSFAVPVVFSATEAKDEDPVASAIANPPATGLLVTRVLEDSQAEKSGVKRGDVIVAYGGEPTPDLPALNSAKAAVREEKSVGMSVVRSGLKISIFLSPGQIGVHLLAVEKGKGRPALPADSGVGFDFSALAGKPRDNWYALYREKEKVGVGRIAARLLGASVYVLTDEVLDLPTSLEDHEVTSTFAAGPRPLAQMTVYRDRMNDWVRYGHRGSGKDAFWTVVTRGAGSDGVMAGRRLPDNVVPVYAMETIVGFMPREEGACFRFIPVYEGSGNFLLESALVCAGIDEIEHGGAKVKAWRYEWRQLDGAVNGIYWVGAEGIVIRGLFGDLRAELTTKDDALRGQHDSVRSRLAK